MLESRWRDIEDNLFKYYQGNKDELEESSRDFLRSINFIDESDGITSTGTRYLDSKFIFDREYHAEILRQELLNLHEIRELCQSFYGQQTERVNVERYFKSKTDVSEEREVGRILDLLNKVDIVSYSKRHGEVQFKETDEVEEEDQESYRTTRRTPYSNLMRFRKTIRSCSGDLFWVDRHWSKKGLEPLAEEVTGDKFASIRILAGPSHIESHVRDDFERFQKEMENRDIEAELRVLTEEERLRSLHDRWLLSSKGPSWNIPPINTIYANQEAEILKTEEELDFEDWWEDSPNIMEDWNSIQKYI